MITHTHTTHELEPEGSGWSQMALLSSGQDNGRSNWSDSASACSRWRRATLSHQKCTLLCLQPGVTHELSL